MKRNHIFLTMRLALSAGFICTFFHCYQPIPGCLEIEAVNFDAKADKNCCCEYPQLIATVNLNFDSQVYFDNRNYLLPSGEWVKIKAVSFYLSDFQFFQNGKQFEVTDTVHLKTFAQPDQKTIVKNDIALVRRFPSQYPLGEFIPDGVFSEVRFSFGLTDPANQAQPKTLRAGHPLRPQVDKMWENEVDGYRFLMLALARDTLSNTKTDTIYWTKRDALPLKFTFLENFKHELGFDFPIQLSVDLKQWFEGVQIKTDNQQQIKTKIVANLQKSFRVEQ